MSKMKKKGRARRIILIVLCVIIGLILAGGCTVFALKKIGEKKMTESTVTAPEAVPSEAAVEDDGKTVIYKGQKYRYNEENINILCMGVDKSISETGEESVGANGQADVLILMNLDTANGTLTMVNIPRDTLVDVSKYNVDGEYTGVEKMQICLAYAYGDGKETSCDNVTEAVGRLLYGMPVHSYAAIDYDAISLLNDAVGGVTVVVLEDMTSVDWRFSEGNTVTLHGQQAHSYVRARDWDRVDANLLRMERQKQYLNAFIQTALTATKSDLSVPLDLYNAASDYMVTNLGASSVAYLASEVIDCGVNEIISFTVPGEMVAGDVYAEYIPDEVGLYEMVLNVFYEAVE